jgi:hypothetical protein
MSALITAKLPSKGNKYYVTFFNDSKYCCALGPYSRAKDAIQEIEAVKKYLNEIDPMSWFYYYGTGSIRMQNCITGKLNLKILKWKLRNKPEVKKWV